MTDDRVPGVSEKTTTRWVCRRCGAKEQAEVKPSKCRKGHAGAMKPYEPPPPNATTKPAS